MIHIYIHIGIHQTTYRYTVHRTHGLAHRSTAQSCTSLTQHMSGSPTPSRQPVRLSTFGNRCIPSRLEDTFVTDHQPRMEHKLISMGRVWSPSVSRNISNPESSSVSCRLETWIDFDQFSIECTTGKAILVVTERRPRSCKLVGLNLSHCRLQLYSCKPTYTPGFLTYQHHSLNVCPVEKSAPALTWMLKSEWFKL